MAEQLENIEAFTKEELEDLTDKTTDFVEMFCDVRFYPYQRKFAEAIVKDALGNLGNTITGLFSRQSGKSESVANTGAGLMVLLPKLANLKDEDNHYLFPQLNKYRKGVKIGIFSPSTLQSSTTYSRLRSRFLAPEARLFMNSAEFARDGHESLYFLNNKSDFLQLSNGSLCRQMSADKQSKIESQTFDIILLDESQDLDEFIVRKSVMPMGAHTNASSVATGTPGTTKGFFYRQIEINKAIDLVRKPKKLQPQLHFQYDYKTVQKYQPNYRKYIASEKTKIGEDSDEFQMAYCLKWLLERGMAVTEELFDQLSDRRLEVFNSLQEIELIAGLDWGKNSDSTVLTIGRPLWEEKDAAGRAPIQVINWWEKVGTDYEAIFAGVLDHIKRFSIRTIACDATGPGEPLVDRLSWELPHVQVIPVKFGAQSKDHLYKWFLLMLQEKMVTWPANPQVKQRKYWKKFQYEMLNLVKEHKNNYLTCHAPEDQKNAHDDYPDSLALMMWCINSMAMPTIEVTTADFYTQRDWYNIPNSRNNFLFGR